VSIGTGIISPHVGRHVRHTRRDGDAGPQSEAAARVSIGTGLVTPHVDRHLRLAVRATEPQGQGASAAPRVSVGNGFLGPSVAARLKRSRISSR